MKSCPECNEQFTDTWITFCPNDGTILTEGQFVPRPRTREGGFGEAPFAEPKSQQAPTWMPRQDPRTGSTPLTHQPPVVPVWQPPPAPPYVKGASQNLAITSMIVGLAGFLFGLLCFLGPVLGITALILGIAALVQIKNSPDTVSGKPFAIVGVVTGSLSVLTYAGLALFFLVMASLGR